MLLGVDESANFAVSGVDNAAAIEANIGHC